MPKDKLSTLKHITDIFVCLWYNHCVYTVNSKKDTLSTVVTYKKS